jgi:tRNA(Arg) A34 adenosine deaminase TadA/predicted kinase
VRLWDGLAAPWQVCFEQAWAAYRAGSLPIGAAVVDPHGRIVGSGRNRIFEHFPEPPQSACLFGHRLAHAEINALLSVDHASVRIKQCTLYTSLEPCALCVGAVRMLGMQQVRFACRDASAGSLELAQATDYMRRGGIQAVQLDQPGLDPILVGLQVEALLSRAARYGLDATVPMQCWEATDWPGVAFGQALFASGTLRQLAADPALHVAQVLDELAAAYRQHNPTTLQPTPRVPFQATAASQLTAAAARRPLVLIVTGPPASGKSSLAHQLSAALGLPLLTKDLFKESLFDSLGWSDRDWSRRLGGASMQLLYRSAEALLEAGQSVVLEAPFRGEWDTDPLRALAERFPCQLVQVVCCAPGPLLVERFRRRIERGERHPGHTDPASLEHELSRLLAERWDAIELGGPVFTVDTANGSVDVAGLVAAIREVA